MPTLVERSHKFAAGNTYAFTSSVASLPIMCMMDLSPPGWYFIHASTFSTLWSTIMIDLPSAISPSTCLLDRRTSGRPTRFVDNMVKQLGELDATVTECDILN